MEKCGIAEIYLDMQVNKTDAHVKSPFHMDLVPRNAG
jgi:hypothetical protein